MERAVEDRAAVRVRRGLVVWFRTATQAPCEGHTPPIPEWKKRPVFREVLPPGDPAAGPAGSGLATH